MLLAKKNKSDSARWRRFVHSGLPDLNWVGSNRFGRHGNGVGVFQRQLLRRKLDIDLQVLLQEVIAAWRSDFESVQRKLRNRSIVLGLVRHLRPFAM